MRRPHRVLVVECWEYDITPGRDLPDVLRDLAETLEAVGGTLLSLIHSADDAHLVQAFVDVA